MSHGNTHIYAPFPHTNSSGCNAAKRLMESIIHIEEFAQDDYSLSSEEENENSPELLFKISERHERVEMMPIKEEIKIVVHKEIEKIKNEINELDKEFNKIPEKFGLDNL